MAMLVCPKCGGMLLPSDDGYCPICRVHIEPADARDAAPAQAQVVETESAETDSVAETRDPGAFEPAIESLFQSARAELAKPSQGGGNWLMWAFLSVVAFVITKQAQPVRDIAILVGVIFFHELGHWLGMQAFGYKDLKMFFLPFFGAAVSGKKEGAPQWQQAIVALLGPIPGIFVGSALLAWNVAAQNAFASDLIRWLLALNIFNLLPLMPLDGGRFLNAVIFSRHRILEALFLVLTSAAVIAVGIRLGAWVFAGAGAIGLFAVPFRFRIAGVAARAKQRWPVWSPRVADATDQQQRHLFIEAQQLLARATNSTASSYANLMRDIHEYAQMQPVGLFASLGLLMMYFSGIVVPILAYLVGVLIARVA